MPFVAGTLCCSQGMCVLLYSSSTWDKIPHVTQMAFSETANTPKLVTSDSYGRELSLCGTVSTTGNLSIACHNGTAPEFCINQEVHLRWAIDCDQIWSGGAVLTPPTGTYYEAIVRITSKPVDLNASQAGATLFNYGWEVVTWVHQGACGGG